MWSGYKGYVSAWEPVTEAREIGAGLGGMLRVYFFSRWMRKSVVSPKEVKVLLPEKGTEMLKGSKII